MAKTATSSQAEADRQWVLDELEKFSALPIEEQRRIIDEEDAEENKKVAFNVRRLREEMEDLKLKVVGE